MKKKKTWVNVGESTNAKEQGTGEYYAIVEMEVSKGNFPSRKAAKKFGKKLEKKINKIILKYRELT